MAEYLCDENYLDIEEILPSLDRRQAIANLNLYIKLLSVLTLEKDYVNYIKPELKAVEVYLSLRTLPDFLTEGTGPVTVLHFLKSNCDFELHDIMSEMEMDLVPIVEFFPDDQLATAYERLINLRELLEEDLNDDTIILKDDDDVSNSS